MMRNELVEIEFETVDNIISIAQIWIEQSEMDHRKYLKGYNAAMMIGSAMM